MGRSRAMVSLELPARSSKMEKKTKNKKGTKSQDSITAIKAVGKEKKRKFRREDDDDDGGAERIDDKREKKKSQFRKRGENGDQSGRQSEIEESKRERGNLAGGRKNLITDARFASAQSDPRFQRMPENVGKVTLDSRFGSMFTDKNYGSSAPLVDKRGKRRKSKGENPLAEYYHLVEEDRGEANASLNSGGESELLSEDEEIAGLSGSDSDTSSSSGDGESDDDSQLGVESDGWRFWLTNQEEAPTIEQETHRLAVVNMDWDHIKAIDLYVLMSTTLLTSCPQSGGQILSVTIYPSDFGLKCMEIEAIRGPHALMDGQNDPSDGQQEDSDNDVDNEVVNEKIRSYQLQRLRYYYAVVECDSVSTASRLYNALDGVEFLRTANVIDLRFIPDSMTFLHSPRDIATEAPVDYKQPDFETTALQHSSVKLTWDDDEPKRKKILRRKFKSDQMDELEQYLASEDSQEEEEEDGHGDDDDRDKYQALLHDNGDDDDDDDDGDDDDDDGKKEMEVTFLPGVENISRHIDKSKLKKSEETVWEAALRRRREKSKSRNNKAMSSDDDDDDDDDDYGSDKGLPEGDDDDFFADESEVAAAARPKKGRRAAPPPPVEAATAAELELLLANDEGEGEHIKGFNLRPKKGKKTKKKKKNEEQLSTVADKLPQVDAAADSRFNSRLSSSLYALDPTDPLFKRSATGMRQENAQNKGKPKNSGGAAGEDRPSSPATAAAPPQDKANKEKHEIMTLVKSLKLKTKALA
ncbi:pre-rRNA-processing ESF1-like protein [Wolffia australiana]